MRSSQKKRTAPTACGLSFDREKNEVVVVEQAADASYDIHRVPADEPRSVSLTALEVRTVTSGWGIHTDRTPVEVSPLAEDKEILASHIQAANESNGSIGVRYAFTRALDNSSVLLTQTRTAHVEETARLAGDWLSKQKGDLKGYDVAPEIRLDTSARALARLWLSGPVMRPHEAEGATTLFLIVGTVGFGIGIWSPTTGFVYETEEPYLDNANNEQLARHIYSNVTKLLSASSLATLSLDPINQLVISTVESFREPLWKVLDEDKSEALKEVRLGLLKPDDFNSTSDAEMDQATALAMGALLESDLVPRLDLSLDLEEQLTVIRDEEDSRQATKARATRAAATIAMIVPLLLVAAFLFSSWYMRRATISSLEQGKEEKRAQLAQLNQENKDYEAAKVNFSVISGLITQIATLRDRQKAPYQFLVDLNQRVPAGDPSWYFSEVNTTGANVEIKGKTKNQQAITVFIRNLENSEGIFTNILLVNNVPGATQTPQAAAQATSGVTDFTIKAVYTPLNNPPPKQAQSPPQAPAPGATQPVNAPGPPTAMAQPGAQQLPPQTQGQAGGLR